MKAIVFHKYGSLDVLQLKEIEKPDLADDGLLVRVRAASVNIGDWYAVTGPFIARTQLGLLKLGVDFVAGTVEAVDRVGD